MKDWSSNMRNTILRKLNRIVISGKCKNSLVRFQSFLALFSFVFSVCSASLFLIPSSLNAQDPIYPIGLTGGGGASGNPTLQLDNYDAAGMQDFFQDVNAQAGDVDSWVALVVDNIGMVRASWESEADLQIQDYVNNLNVSDNYNGVANYRDALQKELNSQKEAALALWERTANTDIYLQLEKYVTSLTGGIEDEAVVNTESSQSNATEVLSNNRLTPEQIKASFAESKEVWENQFHTSADTGLKQYDDSLDAINANYARFMRQLDNADGTFQQNLQAIQEYKNNVKSGIRTTVTNLENFLNEPANDSLFGGSNGKSRTQAGLDLNSLIIEFRALLAPNAQDDFSFILTELASKMREYLGKQAGDAATRQRAYADKILTPYMNDVANPQLANISSNPDSQDGKKQLAYQDEMYNNIFRWTMPGGAGNSLEQILNRSLASNQEVTRILSANIFSSSHPWFWDDAINNSTHTAWGTENNLLKDRNNFHIWKETLNACSICTPLNHQQDAFYYKISYEVKDKTAETNAVTWGNFANQLNSQFSNWQNNLIPVIINWESQAANYNNFYHQWKSNADTLRANAKTEYEASTAKIESDRSKWLLAMENQKKDADKEWDSIESKLTTGDMTKGDLTALLSQTPGADAIAVTDSNAQVNSFNTTLNNLQNTKFNFQSTDYRDEIARYNHTGEKPKDGLSELKKFGIAETIKSALTDPFSNQNSYSIFNPEYNTPSTSVTGINLKTAFTSAFNGVQNLAYVNGTTDAADRYQKEYYDSIVNQYKYTFKKDVMDARRETALDNYMLSEFKLSKAQVDDILSGKAALKGGIDLKAARTAFLNKLSDTDLLSASEKTAYETGTCYKDLAKCAFMETNKDLKSITVENGQIVITREISDGTIHLGDGGVPKEGEPNYNLVGGYQSGKKTDVIRVNMAKMGVVIQNPKDLFTQWTNEDYNAIADNLSDKATELYASAEKDSKLITTGISDSVKRGEQLMQVAMGAAQSAVAKDEMVKSVVQAYLTGGMAGIQSMVKDKIRDAFIDKVAEATGINPDLVRFATGRFEQAKLTKKMNNQASKIGTGVGVMASLALGPVGPLMMAGPMGGALLGAGAGGKLGSSLSGGTLRTTLNNPIVDAGLTMSSGLAGAMMGGPAGLVAGVAAKNKLMQSSSVVSNNNQYNALQQQENALIQDAAGAAVANAIGRPDAAGNFSQILGGLKKRQVAKKNNANLGKVASTGIAAGMNMATGMVKGIVKNAIIAVGGSADTFDHLTANPFTPPATWTGAAKVDMSKEGWKDRIQEYATAEFLEANGMDADLAKTVASTTNAKIKAKKAKKEEKTKAIESTAQTALAVTAMVLTAGAAAPALGSVLTGSAGASFYAVQGANIALQAAIGSRTGGQEGALAGVVNGTLQSLAATNLGALTKGSKELVGKAKEVQQMALDNPILIKALAATNVSYTKEDGWGIKANVTGVVNALGADKSLLNKIANSFNSVTIGQSQRGGATVNLGISTGSGTLGLNYTGNSGKWDGSFDVIERQAGTGNLSAELNYGEDGFSVSGNADLGNGLGFGLESGRNGTTGSLTILGSQQGTVDEDGNYEANSNFLGEISGQDIIDLNEARQAQRDAAENERNPAKSAKDAKNAKDAADAKDARDDDAKEVGGEEGPSGLVDLAFAGLGVVMSAGAAFLAGGGSGSATSSVPASGQSGAGNGNTTTVGRKPEDDDSPQKQPTKEELANFKDNIFLNTTKAATDAYLDKLDAQGVDTKEMRAHAEALRTKGVRDLTPSEIQAKRLKNQIEGDNQDPSKGLTSRELNEYLGLQDKLRANKDLTPEEQERHAYLGTIRNIQLYSDAVGQDGPGGNGIRDGKNEIENARKGEGLYKIIKETLKKSEDYQTVIKNVEYVTGQLLATESAKFTKGWGSDGKNYQWYAEKPIKDMDGKILVPARAPVPENGELSCARVVYFASKNGKIEYYDIGPTGFEGSPLYKKLTITEPSRTGDIYSMWGTKGGSYNGGHTGVYVNLDEAQNKSSFIDWLNKGNRKNNEKYFTDGTIRNGDKNFNIENASSAIIQMTGHEGYVDPSYFESNYYTNPGHGYFSEKSYFERYRRLPSKATFEIAALQSGINDQKRINQMWGLYKEQNPSSYFDPNEYEQDSNGNLLFFAPDGHPKKKR
jgi:hypothetical protein